MSTVTESSPAPAAPTSFAAFRHPGFRMYFFGTATAMLADNVEHVISYWVIFQKFHSPALGGFAVISHWVPYLLFAGITGGLADRFDIRRLIQIGMVMFMGVSVAWGIMFLTDSLTLWMGIYPSSFSSYFDATVGAMVQNHTAALAATTKLAGTLIMNTGH